MKTEGLLCHWLKKVPTPEMIRDLRHNRSRGTYLALFTFLIFLLLISLITSTYGQVLPRLDPTGRSGDRRTEPLEEELLRPPPTITLPAQPGPTKEQDQKTMQGTTASPAKKTPDKLLYKPPLRGAPAGLVVGGTRGMTERESFSLQVLAPNHSGLTVHDQPSIYWYISNPICHPMELTVIERNAVKPLIEKVINCPEKGGIQAIRLADYGVHLRRDVPYKWFVTIVTDPSHRSKDIMAGGVIKLVEPPPVLLAKLKAADDKSAPYIYAEDGIWYDALDSISRMIDASPTNVDLRKQRAFLLGQVGLWEVAEFENR